MSEEDIYISVQDINMSGEDIDTTEELPSSGLIAHLGFGCLKQVEDNLKSKADISTAYQEDGDDESEQSDGAAEDLDDEDLDEEGRVRGVRESSSGADLQMW